jgi:pimeloyl-ACP methyl ester carboxylesterase
MPKILDRPVDDAYNFDRLENGLTKRKKNILWKILLGSVCLVILVYASTSTYLWANQENFIFRPKRSITKTPGDYQLPFEDVFVNVDDRDSQNERIHAWWIPAPAEDRSDRCLIYLHGSALNIQSNITHAKRFYQMGFSVFLVSYRGYGKSDGAFPSEAKVYADARSAWRYLIDQKGFEARNIFIYGHSLGGAVAIQLALTHPDAGGLIVESTFTSIGDMARRIPKYRIFPLDLLVHQRFDSISKVGRLQIPVLYIHGTADTYVPPEMSRKLFDHTASYKQIKLIDGGGHNNSAHVGGAEYLQAVRNFIDFSRKAI